MTIATEELRKLVDHANERPLRVMPIDADMVASIAAELITARETLEEWKASQHYSYIGADGKTVKARDLEDELITARAKLEAAEGLVEALDRVAHMDDSAQCCGNGVSDGFAPPECCGQPEYGLDRASRIARAAIAAWEAVK